jgi:hypothetical protein
VSPELAARLETAEIRLAAQTQGFWLFVRENCMALVHSDDRGFSIGSSGMMTEAGIAYLVWREGRAMLAAHGGAESPAAPDQLKAIGNFAGDLKRALQSLKQE